jgi:hypothetical protein
MNEHETMRYDFSEAEIRGLALLLRKHEAVLDTRLDAFSAFIEGSLYRMMTIEEAEDFFK